MRSHRNVLRVYGYTDEPDVTAIVMELADRGSLDIILAVCSFTEINFNRCHSDGLYYCEYLLLYFN